MNNFSKPPNQLEVLKSVVSQKETARKNIVIDYKKGQEQNSVPTRTDQQQKVKKSILSQNQAHATVKPKSNSHGFRFSDFAWERAISWERTVVFGILFGILVHVVLSQFGIIPEKLPKKAAWLLENSASEWKEVTRPLACQPPFIRWNANEYENLEKGSIMYNDRLLVPEDVALSWSDADIEILSEHLASIMTPIDGYNFEEAFAVSLNNAKSNHGCVVVTDPTAWMMASLNAYYEGKPEQASQQQQPMTYPTRQPTQQPVPTQQQPRPTQKVNIEIVESEAEVAFVMQPNTEFYKMLSSVELACSNKFDGVDAVKACFNKNARKLAYDVNNRGNLSKTEALDNSFTEIQKSIAGAGSFCSNNLGQVYWDNLISGDNAIWNGVTRFYAVGSPGNLSLLDDVTGTCARVKNGPNDVMGYMWITYFKDPFMPGSQGTVYGGVITREAKPNTFSKILRLESGISIFPVH